VKGTLYIFDEPTTGCNFDETSPNCWTPIRAAAAIRPQVILSHRAQPRKLSARADIGDRPRSGRRRDGAAEYVAEGTPGTDCRGSGIIYFADIFESCNQCLNSSQLKSIFKSSLVVARRSYRMADGLTVPLRRWPGEGGGWTELTLLGSSRLDHHAVLSKSPPGSIRIGRAGYLAAKGPMPDTMPSDVARRDGDPRAHRR